VLSAKNEIEKGFALTGDMAMMRGELGFVRCLSDDWEWVVGTHNIIQQCK